MPDFSVFVGNPAKFLCNIREIKSKKTGVGHYPWMENYDKDMPWEKIGFEAWLEQNQGE